MLVITITLFLMLVAFAAGILGVLTGLGGGVLLVPALLMMQVNMRAAMAASLIAIMTLSITSALTSTGQQYTNIRMGIFLETAAVLGAIIGALITGYISVAYLSIIFALVLLFASYSSYLRSQAEKKNQKPEVYTQEYIHSISFANKKQLIQSWSLMGFAGALSGILGIGSGSLKVLAMDQILNMPYRVSTSTSNFMVGMTVAASIGIYFQKGYVDLSIIFPIVLGSFLGSLVGSKILAKAKIGSLRLFFIFFIVILALQMMYKGIKGI